MSGEFELIAAIRERLAAGGAAGESKRVVLGSGDDAAISAAGGATATSVDMLVEGVHFEAPPFSLRDVGHKALAVALSDLAAMGAEPAEAYVQLGAPHGRDDDELLEIADGIGGVAAQYGVVVAGGDLSAAPVLTIAVTVVGTADSAEAFVRRSGARPGDHVAVTGELGGAAAALLWLRTPQTGIGLEDPVGVALYERQATPRPRIAAGRALAEAGAHAMIDVSDGVFADAAHLAEASGVELVIESRKLPVATGVERVAAAAGVDPLELVAGGEDYELLVTMAPSAIDTARSALGAAGLTVIGRVEPGAGVKVSGPDGPVRIPAGFDQRRRSQGPADNA